MGNIPTVYAPLFEHFKPRSEWRHEDGYDTLLVYLPGFKNIEVTTEDLNIVRVHGGRFTDEGNWSEVNEDYRVPETCEMSGIRSRFDGGILTITMPRRKIANTVPPPPPPPTTTTATQVPPITADEQTFKRTKQEEPLPKPKEELKENKPVDKPQSTDNSTNLPPQPIIMPTFPDEPDKLQAQLKPQINPLEDNTLTLPPPTSSYSTPSKQEPMKTTLEAKDQENGEFAFGSLPANVPKNDKHNAVEKPNVAEKTWLDEGKGMHALLEEMNKNFKDGMGEKNDGRGGFQGDDKMEENKKVVASSGVMNDEDRKKLLVNVGVGVLVIVALLSYTTGLIGKGNCN